MSLSKLVFLSIFAAGIAGCTSHSPTDSQQKSVAPTVRATLSEDQNSAKDQYGNPLVVQKVAGKPYIQIQGTFSPAEFANLGSNKQLAPALKTILAQLKTVGAITLDEIPEFGFFTALIPFNENLLGKVQALNLQYQTYLNPVVYDPDALKKIKLLKTARPLSLASGDDSGLEGYAGHAPIRAPEFIKQVEAQLGGSEKINGSSVKLGVVDTGITYNHPAFESSITGKSRVIYMKDFTREGRIYFNPLAAFSADIKDGSDEVLVSGQVILTPRTPQLPAGDIFTEIKQLKILASAELKADLVRAGVNAKLGVFLEGSLQSDNEPVDLNANGKTDDKLVTILIPGDGINITKIYFDKIGAGDFRNLAPLSNFNSTGNLMSVGKEKIGFAIGSDKLMGQSGEVVPLISASIVGFDPGNHGSHVTGIAAGNIPLVRGVAPEASLLVNRVCANNGGCGSGQAIIDLALNGGAEMINMSIGGLDAYNDGFGVEETIVNRVATLKNVLVIISAGNSGPGRQTIGSPSNARLSLSVGAAASKEMIRKQYQWPGLGSTDGGDEFMLFFSSRGPTSAGGFKPNVVAPGTELSSIQLNSAPGSRGGLDVYWGTSMSAPTVTGAFALLLDAVKKYNAKFPERALSTNVLVLRDVLIESARSFDVNKFDPQSNERTLGQYTWVDQGKGMINLPAAWDLLQKIRDEKIPGSVKLGGSTVDLDYQVVISQIGPNGIHYDGSETYSPQGATGAKLPMFGTGLYLDYYGTETLRPVHIQRSLTELDATGEYADDLNRQLLSTGDEFVLKTVMYGSDKVWLKAGTLEQLDCWDSETSRPRIIGRGVDVNITKDGKGEIVPFKASVINFCLNRDVIKSELAPGDHGALISAYRVVGGVASSVPSFTIPVYVAVPHRTLGQSTAYETEGVVSSFGVVRNYVTIPSGTRIAKITLEVPAYKAGANNGCQGVELMALEGGNTLAPKESRAQLRVANCSATGAPDNSKRTLDITRINPKAGSWDLHVFGRYQFKRSNFKLRVDYVIADSSIVKIEGDVRALNGSFDWSIKEASFSLSPSVNKSEFSLTGLKASANFKIAQDAQLVIPGPTGLLRKYPAGTLSVTVATGNSPGNDLDTLMLACPSTVTSPDDTSCEEVASSGGATDIESMTVVPDANKVYVVRVQGYTIKDEGNFTATETLTSPSENGTLSFSDGVSAGKFVITYGFSDEQVDHSQLLQSELFKSGAYQQVVGSLKLISESEIPLDVIPVSIRSK